MLYWLPLIGLALLFVSTFEAKFQMLQSSKKTRKPSSISLGWQPWLSAWRLSLRLVTGGAAHILGQCGRCMEASGIGSELLVQVTMDGAVLPLILWTIIDRGLPS
jgi:hypothetical protein